MRACIPLACLVLFATSAGTCLHASTWIELTSSRFTVETDAPESVARHLVTQLEQFDGAIAHSLGSAPAFSSSGGPLKIYLFRTVQEFSEFRKEPWAAGLTVSSSPRVAPVIVLYAGPRTRDTALHEYVHALVRMGDWKLPHWFEEGLAELYAHSEPIDRDTLSIGRRLPEYVAQLQSHKVTASLLASNDRHSDHGLYYAASWALVHMLLLEPANRPATERLLATGAWEASFKDLLIDLQAYLARPVWNQAPVNASARATLAASVKPIAPLDVEFMLADLLLECGLPDAARLRYRKISSTHSQDAAGAEAAGLAALAGGTVDLALQQFQRAIDLQSNRARVWAELAALERERGSSWNTVKPLLERAVSLDPANYQSAYLLGIHESDDGDFQRAVPHLAAAAKAAPAQADVWHAYALALNNAGRLEDARLAATRSVRVAASAESERMASELLAVLDHPPRPGASVRRQPEVVTSPGWTRRAPDATVQGLFLEFVCEADPPRFRVEVEGGSVMELLVTDPSQVNILNPVSGEASIELKCGPQNRRPIAVGFRRADSTVLEVKFPQVHDLQRF